MKQAHRFSGKGGAYEGLTKLTNGGPVWTGKIKLVPEKLDEPLRTKKPTKFFVNSMSDLFHEDVPWDYIEKVMNIIYDCPQHIFQVLTKRPERAVEFFGGTSGMGLNNEPIKNLWLGVSAEDQQTADERISLILMIPAGVHWVSLEPLLGPVSFRWAKWHDYKWQSERGDSLWELDGLKNIDWVVTGGESGPGARPAHPDWFRTLRDQCVAADVPFFFKQWGNYCHPEQLSDENFHQWDVANNAGGNPDINKNINFGKKFAGRTLDGQTWDQYPA